MVCTAPDARLTSRRGEPHPKTRGRLWSMPPGSRATEGTGRGWAPVRGHLPLAPPPGALLAGTAALPRSPVSLDAAALRFLPGGPGWRGALGAWHRAGGLRLVTPLSPQRPLRGDPHTHLTDGKAESPGSVWAAPLGAGRVARALQSPPLPLGRGRESSRAGARARAGQDEGAGPGPAASCVCLSPGHPVPSPGLPDGEEGGGQAARTRGRPGGPTQPFRAALMPGRH